MWGSGVWGSGVLGFRGLGFGVLVRAAVESLVKKGLGFWGFWGKGFRVQGLGSSKVAILGVLAFGV